MGDQLQMWESLPPKSTLAGHLSMGGYKYQSKVSDALWLEVKAGMTRALLPVKL